MPRPNVGFSEILYTYASPENMQYIIDRASRAKVTHAQILDNILTEERKRSRLSAELAEADQAKYQLTLDRARVMAARQEGLKRAGLMPKKTPRKKAAKAA